MADKDMTATEMMNHLKDFQANKKAKDPTSLGDITREDMLTIMKELQFDNISSKLGSELMKKHGVTKDNLDLNKWMEIGRIEATEHDALGDEEAYKQLRQKNQK